MHLVAAVPNGIWTELFIDTRILNVMRLFVRSLEVSDGFAGANRPGLGIEFDYAAVDRFAADWVYGRERSDRSQGEPGPAVG